MRTLFCANAKTRTVISRTKREKSRTKRESKKVRQGANPYFANESKCDKTRNLILRTALSANFIDFRDLSQILTIREFYVRAEPFSQFKRSLTLSFAFGPTIDFLIRVPSLIFFLFACGKWCYQNCPPPQIGPPP